MKWGFISLLVAACILQNDAALPRPDRLRIPAWARSAAIVRDDATLFDRPDWMSRRLGTAEKGARLPLIEAARGLGCDGSWLLVGDSAWVCDSVVDVSREEPFAKPRALRSDQLPFRYYFVDTDSVYDYPDIESGRLKRDGRQLSPGFGLAISTVQTVGDQRWGHMSTDRWVPMNELRRVQPSLFSGEEIHSDVGFALDFGWVNRERAKVFSYPIRGASPAKLRAIHDKVFWGKTRIVDSVEYVQTSPDDKKPAEWMLVSDVAHPTIAAPPSEVERTDERWIDVDLSSQTLVAYQGARPVFATLVSTGTRKRGLNFSTPKGVNRIWVKLFISNMSGMNDATSRYSVDGVPFVQFFDAGVGLHGAYAHDLFGRTMSHGCVNLAPSDAERLFYWTTPTLPDGWSAVLSSSADRGTIVRVR